MTTGQNMKAARERLGLSLRQVGDRLGVVRQQVQNWEAGRYQPGPKYLLKIAETLQIKISDLVNTDGK